MGLRAMGVTIDCSDPERLADFWSEAIGFTHRDGDGGPYITISNSDVDRAVNHPVSYTHLTLPTILLV